MSSARDHAEQIARQLAPHRDEASIQRLADTAADVFGLVDLIDSGDAEAVLYHVAAMPETQARRALAASVAMLHTYIAIAEGRDG